MDNRIIAIVKKWKDQHSITMYANWTDFTLNTGSYTSNEQNDIYNDIYSLAYQEYFASMKEYYLTVQQINVKSKSDL